MIVLARDLAALGVSHEELKLFRKHYPRGWRPTRASIGRARRLNLDVSWYARAVLPQSLMAEYDIGRMKLCAKYAAKCKPLMSFLNMEGTDAFNVSHSKEYVEKYTALHRECAAKRDALLAAAFKAYEKKVKEAAKCRPK